MPGYTPSSSTAAHYFESHQTNSVGPCHLGIFGLHVPPRHSHQVGLPGSSALTTRSGCVYHYSRTCQEDVEFSRRYTSCGKEISSEDMDVTLHSNLVANIRFSAFYSSLMTSGRLPSPGRNLFPWSLIRRSSSFDLPLVHPRFSQPRK